MKPFALWILRFRFLVIGLTIIITGVLGSHIKNLKVIIDPNNNLPQDHHYVRTTNEVEARFASKNILTIGVTPRVGDALQPYVLTIVARLSTALSEMPEVIPNKVLSLSSHRAKNIIGTSEGIEVHPFMENIPQTPEAIQSLRQALKMNPVYTNLIVSTDSRTAAIILELRDPQRGYQGVMRQVQSVVNETRDESVDIAIGGWPVIGAQLENYSERMIFLFPVAVLLIGFIHYDAFRTFQGLILPLVTAILAVVSGMGIMGLTGVPMDAFNVVTPILILAVAAGHAVQILKRYYEEYRPPSTITRQSLRQANDAAVVASLTKIGPVMLAAGLAAALAFLSLLVFNLTVIRTFGLFTGLGILSALVLEMTFIPALRSILPAPRPFEQRRERETRTWDRVTLAIAGLVVGRGRRYVYVLSAVLLACSIIGASRVAIDDSLKGYFFQNLPFRAEDRTINRNLGGTYTLYILVEGNGENTMKNPAVLKAMESTQRYLEEQPFVGKTVSLADFIKRMHRAMHGDDASYDTIPQDRELIAQYLLLYSMSGQPEDFDSYVDYDYSSASIWVFLKTDSTAYLQKLLSSLPPFLGSQFDAHTDVMIGGGATTNVALNEVIVRGKILNILQIGGVIFIIASVLFRSLLAGFLVLLPLSLAVIVNFGLMGLTGIPLNTATAVISAMAVGIGADYAIYLIYRLKEELTRGVGEALAFRTALTTAGKAILFVASAIAGGYAVLLSSWGFKVHIWFGLLTVTAMMVSAISALTLLPSLIWTLRPRFVFGVGHDSRTHPR